jgi:hypothetical protein
MATVIQARAGTKFFKENGVTKIIPKGAKVRKTKVVFPQGKGVRLLYRFNSSLRSNSKNVLIKNRQAKAERAVGVRVGNGLFDDIFSAEPKVIGVVTPQRKKQQNPASGKKIKLRKGGKKGKAPKGSDPARNRRLRRQGL